MRLLTLVLTVLLALVSIEIFTGNTGQPRVAELSSKLAQQRARNELARERNARLSAEVSDLKDGLEMVEEKARHDLGMVRPDEILVQFQSLGKAPAPSVSPAANRSSAPQGERPAATASAPSAP